MTLLDRLADPQLYGRLAAFRDRSTWTAWLVFVEAVHGLPLASDAERDLFAKHTGRQVYVDHLDAWLMEQSSLVNARRRAVHPVVRERQQLVDSLARLLGLLGLERRAKRVHDLGEYLEARASSAGAEVGDPPA